MVDRRFKVMGGSRSSSQPLGLVPAIDAKERPSDATDVPPTYSQATRVLKRFL